MAIGDDSGMAECLLYGVGDCALAAGNLIVVRNGSVRVVRGRMRIETSEVEMKYNYWNCPINRNFDLSSTELKTLINY